MYVFHFHIFRYCDFHKIFFERPGQPRTLQKQIAQYEAKDEGHDDEEKLQARALKPALQLKGRFFGRRAAEQRADRSFGGLSSALAAPIFASKHAYV